VYFRFMMLLIKLLRVLMLLLTISCYISILSCGIFVKLLCDINASIFIVFFMYSNLSV
jgi:hypothetical protein